MTLLLLVANKTSGVAVQSVHLLPLPAIMMFPIATAHRSQLGKPCLCFHTPKLRKCFIHTLMEKYHRKLLKTRHANQLEATRDWFEAQGVKSMALLFPDSECLGFLPLHLTHLFTNVHPWHLQASTSSRCLPPSYKPDQFGMHGFWL